QASAATGRGEPAPAAASTVARIAIDGAPGGAAVTIDGVPLDGPPHVVELVADGSQHVVRVSAPGHLDREIVVVASGDVTVAAGLTPSPERAPVRRASSGAASTRRGAESSGVGSRDRATETARPADHAAPAPGGTHGARESLYGPRPPVR